MSREVDRLEQLRREVGQIQYETPTEAKLRDCLFELIEAVQEIEHGYKSNLQESLKTLQEMKELVVEYRANAEGLEQGLRELNERLDSPDWRNRR